MMKLIDFLNVIDDNNQVVIYTDARVDNPTPALHDKEVWKIELFSDDNGVGYDVYLEH